MSDTIKLVPYTETPIVDATVTLFTKAIKRYEDLLAGKCSVVIPPAARDIFEQELVLYRELLKDAKTKQAIDKPIPV